MTRFERRIITGDMAPDPVAVCGGVQTRLLGWVAVMPKGPPDAEIADTCVWEYEELPKYRAVESVAIRARLFRVRAGSTSPAWRLPESAQPDYYELFQTVRGVGSLAVRYVDAGHLALTVHGLPEAVEFQGPQELQGPQVMIKPGNSFRLIASPLSDLVVLATTPGIYSMPQYVEEQRPGIERGTEPAILAAP